MKGKAEERRGQADGGEDAAAEYRVQQSMNGPGRVAEQGEKQVNAGIHASLASNLALPRRTRGGGACSPGIQRTFDISVESRRRALWPSAGAWQTRRRETPGRWSPVTPDPLPADDHTRRSSRQSRVARLSCGAGRS